MRNCCRVVSVSLKRNNDLVFDRKVTHHVSIKRDLSAVHRDVQSLQMQQELIRVNFILLKL